MASFRKRDSMGFYDETDPVPLPERFARLKRRLVGGNAAALSESWDRLLRALQAEVDLISAAGPEIIPTIDFGQIGDAAATAGFSRELKRCGAAVIRNVVPREEASAWMRETGEYLAANPQTAGSPPDDPQLLELFWSPAQVKARAHPNVLAAQRFAMGLWHAGDGKQPPVSGRMPVAYADRVRVRQTSQGVGGGGEPSPLRAHVDGGSVERWEPDGYGGATGTYLDVFRGRWEDYDPWDSGARFRAGTDLYKGAGSYSMFRMFQGWLALSDLAPGEGTLHVCPMLKLSTAYFLLRPFFSSDGSTAGGSIPDASLSTSPSSSSSSSLSSSGWTLDSPQNSILHGALPSYTQVFHGALHPHLRLDRSLRSIPALGPGDYVLWHPDTIHAIEGGASSYPCSSPSSSPPSFSYSTPSTADKGKDKPDTAAAAVLYIPACPLTQTNALFLARQRKAFLLGRPGPDFDGGGRGETCHAGRPGAAEVSEAGGDEALRAMGLLPWEEEYEEDEQVEEGEGADDGDHDQGQEEEGRGSSGDGDRATRAGRRAAERELVRMANALLFPDRFGMAWA